MARGSGVPGRGRPCACCRGRRQRHHPERALADGHVAGPLELGAGSWGAGKDFSRLGRPAGVHDRRGQRLRCNGAGCPWWPPSGTATAWRTRRPDLDQLLRTLLNALASDWAFMVTRDQAVDYARRRVEGHRDDFHRLASLVEDGDADRRPGRGAAPGRHRPERSRGWMPGPPGRQPVAAGLARAQQPGRHAAHDERAGKAPRATALAATTEPEPMSVPRRTVTLVPIHTSSPIRTGDFTMPWSLMGTCEVVGAVVEVADVDVVAERGSASPMLDVEVAVDGVARAEHRLVADPQRALVRAEPGAVAEVHPGAEHDPAVALAAPRTARPGRGTRAPRVSRAGGRQPRRSQPPVAHQVVAAVGPVRARPSRRPRPRRSPQRHLRAGRVRSAGLHAGEPTL